MTSKLSRPKISLINSLSIKKYRQQHNLFLVEGHKIVSEILNSEYNIRYLLHTDKWIVPDCCGMVEIFEIDNADMKKISNLKTPPSVIAVVEIPVKDVDVHSLKDKLTLAIDDIQDPGNLGTIIRICDWFGIENIICSENSVDLYNPKVIQATMGAFLRVNVFYKDLNRFITEYKKETVNVCYGTFLEGENIYKTRLEQNAIIILGNEGQGISQTIESKIDKKILIPPYNENKDHAESLNISIAAAIVCSEFRRNLQ